MSIGNQLGNVVIVEGVHHREKVLPIGKPILGQLVGEVDHEFRDVSHVWPQILNREFVIHGHILGLNLVHPEEHFLSIHYLFEKVVIDHDLWWNK